MFVVPSPKRKICSRMTCLRVSSPFFFVVVSFYTCLVIFVMHHLRVWGFLVSLFVHHLCIIGFMFLAFATLVRLRYDVLSFSLYCANTFTFEVNVYMNDVSFTLSLISITWWKIHLSILSCRTLHYIYLHKLSKAYKGLSCSSVWAWLYPTSSEWVPLYSPYKCHIASPNLFFLWC